MFINHREPKFDPQHCPIAHFWSLMNFIQEHISEHIVHINRILFQQLQSQHYNYLDSYVWYKKNMWSICYLQNSYMYVRDICPWWFWSYMYILFMVVLIVHVYIWTRLCSFDPNFYDKIEAKQDSVKAKCKSILEYKIVLLQNVKAFLHIRRFYTFRKARKWSTF